MGWLRIENTDVSVLDILEMLAESRSTNQILRCLPSISAADIASAAAQARYLIIYHWAVCRSPDSALRTNRRQWSTIEDSPVWTAQKELELAGLFRSGASVGDIARIFRTRKTDIIERLKKLEMI